MIPHLPRQHSLSETVGRFLLTLEKTRFSGEVRADFAQRLLASTDNSIYQILPQAVLFPKTTADLVEVFKLANQEAFHSLTFSPRGGGTGTNGQSLSPGIVLDCSKYMTQILEVNTAAGWVRVQPGVVLDQLNAWLEPEGVCFAPTLSPSSRATLGGMINTDACGKGSRRYGRTSDHLLGLSWVLSDGTVGTSEAIPQPAIAAKEEQPGRLGQIYQVVNRIVREKQTLIEQQFPKMPRFLTGYNLAKVLGVDPVTQATTFDLNRILAGSEGTLAVITEAKLKLTPLPKSKALWVLSYRCFDDALADSARLLALNPAAIETLDETLLGLAQQDEIYRQVQAYLSGAGAINLVEFVDYESDQGTDDIGKGEIACGCQRVRSHDDAANLWELRKRGVGLLGNRPGPRKPIAFIEDTAVPPAQLPAYVTALKALLDSYGLDYAMYGHVDVGCLHVRPTLDMQSPQDERLIREISDRVVALVRDFGGVMWAEHGRGFRSEYTPLFFGEELYQDLRRIKAAFDPHNRLNPGKIVTPAGSDAAPARLEAPLRGHFDRQVPAPVQASYEVAFSCNGNGACFNVAPHQVMCPSYKGSQERIHSPKGRATLLREWLRQLAPYEASRSQTEAINGSPSASLSVNLSANPSAHVTLESPGAYLTRAWSSLRLAMGRYDYSQEVYQAMRGCLSCKACASQCPIHVDIPSLKAQFLQRYHSRYLRSPRDYLMGYIEAIALWQARFPRLSNALLQAPMMQQVMTAALGLVTPPRLSQPPLAQELTQKRTQELAPQSPARFTLKNLKGLAQADASNSVILLTDAFTSAYEAPLVLATYDLLIQLGFEVFISPPIFSGKLLHVLGFLAQFQRTARRNLAFLAQLQAFGIPIVGLEPSWVLTWRDEYRTWGSAIPANPESPAVLLPQEFLSRHLERIQQRSLAVHPSNLPSPQLPYQLLGHCTEKTLAPASQVQWQQVFAAAGLDLTLVESGCCGMAGLYGYEAEHFARSHSIYQLSWAEKLPVNAEHYPCVLATGISCRSQVMRFSHWRPLHPLEALQQTFCKQSLRNA